MGKIGYEEALAENEALKDQIAIVLAQKKVLRKSYDKLLEENKKLKEENKNLKESLENDFTFKTTNGGKMNVLTMIRQQAVKEFAEKLKSLMLDREYQGVFYKQAVFSDNDIDDLLLKEYGVELWTFVRLVNIRLL